MTCEEHLRAHAFQPRYGKCTRVPTILRCRSWTGAECIATSCGTKREERAKKELLNLYHYRYPGDISPSRPMYLKSAKPPTRFVRRRRATVQTSVEVRCRPGRGGKRDSADNDRVKRSGPQLLRWVKSLGRTLLEVSLDQMSQPYCYRGRAEKTGCGTIHEVQVCEDKDYTH